MRIVRFIDANGTTRWGQSVDATQAIPIVGDLFGPLKLTDKPVEIATRLAPVEPPNILAIGRNYRDHAAEMHAETEAEPLVFLKATTSVVGPDEPILLPRSAPDEVDFEAELAIVIGRAGKDIPESKAMEHVLGYTCANDVSARDCQKRRDKQWARGKSFDTFCPLGPVLVTRDELDASLLTIRSTLNGKVMQQSNTSEMIFSVPTLVSFLSHQFRLPPGTVILTGTPAGVGAGRVPPVFLRSGDEIAVEIEGIGTLSNRVISPS